MLDTCYAMLESIVTVTVWLVVLMFCALVEFVDDTSMAGGACFRALLSVTTAIDMLYRAHYDARAHARARTHVSGNRSLLHALQWHVARIRQLRRGASL